MAENIKLAVLVEKDLAIRKKTLCQINAIGSKRIIERTTPNLARRCIVINNKSGLLVIGNNYRLDDCMSLIRFCRARLANWVIFVVDHIDSDASAADAFAAGADDVVRAQFSPREFEARLKLRLSQSPFVNGEKALVKDNALADARLTQTELEIMNILLAQKGKIVTRNQLSRHLENQDWIYGDRKYDVHITNIRKKLKDNLGSLYKVKSLRSVGYYVQELGGQEETSSTKP